MIQDKGKLMKFISLLFFIFSVISLTACQEKSTNKTSSNTNALCIGTGYYTVPGCPGYVNPNNSCIGAAYYQPGCPGHTGGTTSGGTATGGSTSGGTTGSTNPYTSVPSNSVTPNWGVKYPGGIPSGSCSDSYEPSGINFTPYETRKATMTIVGQTWYSPYPSTIAGNYMNTSSLLKNVTGARQLFSTDSTLKVRFKVIQQPESTSSSPYCYGRMPGASIAGYTKLQFNVQLRGVRANGVQVTEPIGTYTVGVNSCTPAIDLSSYASTYPGGIYLIVDSVKGNQGYFPANYDDFGFRDVDSFVDIRSMDCWVLDVEVAADGTKTFD